MFKADIDRSLERLTLLGRDESGWCTLYCDEGTGELWEVTYPHGEMHGGGPRQLTRITHGDASRRYPGVSF
jgi:hypothetical protein